MPNSKQSWDTRAWLVGIVGGSVGVGCFVLPLLPRVAARLSVVLPNGNEWISASAAVLSVLVLPAVLSGIARRRTFLWGIIPSLLLLVALGIVASATHGWKGLSASFWPVLLVLGAAWLVSSGPVSLFRWLRARAVRRHAALLASYAAMREAGAETQEGVWPPPPSRSVL